MLHPAPAGRWQTSAMSVEKWLLRANRWVLVALMATMAMLVFANVVSRYVLNYSLIWVEELTRYLMVWVGFLGAGLVLRLGAHIAVDAFQDLLPARAARALRVCIVVVLAVTFAAMTWLGSPLRGVRLGPGDAGHELEHGSDLPRNPDRLRASLGSSCFHRPRLRAQSRIRQGRDFHSEVVNTALIVVFLAALVLGVPIAFAMVIAAIAAILVQGSIDPMVAVQNMFAGIDSFPLLAIPFFILAAELMSGGALTEVLLRFASLLVGHVRGGLGHANVLTLTFFSGISGSALADAAGPGSMLIRMMKKAGYAPAYAAALTAATAIVGPIIPPSIIMIIYALTETSVSIMGLFLGGVVPG